MRFEHGSKVVFVFFVEAGLADDVILPFVHLCDAEWHRAFGALVYFADALPP